MEIPKDILAQQPAPTSSEPPKKVFKSIVKSMQMIAPGGERVIFVSGRYINEDANIIAFLEKAIKDNVPGIYVDKDELVYSPDIHDPMAMLKKKMREEILAEEAARMAEVAGSEFRNMGQSVQPKLTPASTSDIVAIAAGAGPSALSTIQIGKK